MNQDELVKRIQDALGTAETDEALIEVVRNAHKAEQKLAAIENALFDKGLFIVGEIR